MERLIHTQSIDTRVLDTRVLDTLVAGVKPFSESETFIHSKSEARRAWRARGARAAAVPARRCLPEKVPTLALIPRTSGEDGTVCVSWRWYGVWWRRERVTEYS